MHLVETLASFHVLRSSAKWREAERFQGQRNQQSVAVGLDAVGADFDVAVQEGCTSLRSTGQCFGQAMILKPQGFGIACTSDAPDVGTSSCRRDDHYSAMGTD